MISVFISSNGMPGFNHSKLTRILPDLIFFVGVHALCFCIATKVAKISEVIQRLFTLRGSLSKLAASLKLELRCLNISLLGFFPLATYPIQFCLTHYLLGWDLTISKLPGELMIFLPPSHSWASLVAQKGKNLPTIQETQLWSLGQDGPLEKKMAAHISILAWRIPWTGEPGGLQSVGSQRVGQTEWLTL